MKKILSLALAAVLALSLVACGGDNNETTAPETTAPAVETTAPETTTPETTVPETTVPETTTPVETTVPETTVPETTAHVHDYKTKKVEPTCTKKGYTAYACACGESYRDDYVDAKGHQYKDTKVEPTETTDGYTHHECQVCGDAYNDNFVDALGGNQPAETKPAETKPAETTPPATEPAETKPSGSAAIGNTTPETLTYSQWSSWDKQTQQEFKNKYPLQNYRGATYYHYNQMAFGNGYECPGPCRCETEAQHNRWSSEVCFHCGKVGNDCPSNYAKVDNYGYSHPDATYCPQYDVKNDPTRYCQECGRPCDPEVESDPRERCRRAINPFECPYCGVMIEVGVCHCCNDVG